MSFILALANTLGRLGFNLWASRRRITIDNLMAAGLCSDKTAARRITSECFRTFTVMLAESFVLRRGFTRVPLISTFCVRTGPLKREVHFNDLVHYERTDDQEQDALQITQILTNEVEKIARRFPGQYMWWHRRWKH